MPAFGLITLDKLVLDTGYDVWVVVLSSWYQATHIEFLCTLSGEDVKTEVYPKTGISEDFWSVYIQATQFPPTYEKECPGYIADKHNPLDSL